jgi:hypothetical protein
MTSAAGAEETVTSPVADEAPSAAAVKSKNKKKKKGKAVVKSMEEMSVEEFERSLQQMNQQYVTLGIIYPCIFSLCSLILKLTLSFAFTDVDWDHCRQKERHLGKQPLRH